MHATSRGKHPRTHWCAEWQWLVRPQEPAFFIRSDVPKTEEPRIVTIHGETYLTNTLAWGQGAVLSSNPPSPLPSFRVFLPKMFFWRSYRVF